MEKEALEEVVVRIIDQMKEKGRALQSLTAEKVSSTMWTSYAYTQD